MNKKKRIKPNKILTDANGNEFYPDAELSKGVTISSRTLYCPLCMFSKLVLKNISLTHSIKACLKCKRKFTFVRGDTKEGRALRVKEWRKARAGRVAIESQDAVGIFVDEFKEF